MALYYLDDLEEDERIWVECPNCHREYPTMAYFTMKQVTPAPGYPVVMRCVYCWRFGWSHAADPVINKQAQKWSEDNGLEWIHDGLDEVWTLVRTPYTRP